MEAVGWFELCHAHEAAELVKPRGLRGKRHPA